MCRLYAYTMTLGIKDLNILGFGVCGDPGTNLTDIPRAICIGFVSLFFFFAFLLFLGPLLRHMEVPRPGVGSQL